MIKLQIDGQECQAEQGSMIIEAADAANITIPRFCYHKKLSVAANCRMCLVEVERSGKPLPACATPVTDGMVVHTRSKKALAAQRSVMEFLLINHPLDCPVCDQAGECELQDVSMGYGGDISRYSLGKRSVADKEIGPLIATEMTRCIHCTRCVRFGAEVAHMPELGVTGRGEHEEIGTFIDKVMQSEVSANAIDVCPVGALTNKPFRFSSRTWELEQTESISPHDCVGTNMLYHSRSGKIVRAVPAENEQVNEVWCADRDRFASEGFKTNRLEIPMVKINGSWQQVSWEEALDAAASALAGRKDLATLLSPSSTVEEGYLAQKITRAVGSNNIDHRLRAIDTRDDQFGVYPQEQPDLAKLEQMGAILLVGSNTRHEQPILALRLRKAASMGTKIAVINAQAYDFLVEPDYSWITAAGSWVTELAAVAKAMVDAGANAGALNSLLASISATDEHKEFAKELMAGNGAVILGSQAINHPFAAELRALANFISTSAKAAQYNLTEGANSAGLTLAGAHPSGSTTLGDSALKMCQSEHSAYLLLNVELEDVFDAPNLLSNLDKASAVVAMCAYDSDVMRAAADVLLPVGLPSETSGTFVNMFGAHQSFTGSAMLPGEARPAWKVLRVLGNFLHIDGFDYESTEQIANELQLQLSQTTTTNYNWSPTSFSVTKFMRLAPVSLYNSDAMVRKSAPLQELEFANSKLQMSSATASEFGITNTASVKDANGQWLNLNVQIDPSIAPGTFVLEQGSSALTRLGGLSQLEIQQGKA